MSDFGITLYVSTNVYPEKLNAVYKKFFSIATPLAPSRACVCVNWASENWNTNCVAMEFYGSKLTKKNVHVQSISRWAPACIGPYAQVCPKSYSLIAKGKLCRNSCGDWYCIIPSSSWADTTEPFHNDDD